MANFCGRCGTGVLQEMVLLANHLDFGPLALLPCKKTTFETYTRVVRT
jgi:hypothetical protein